MNISLIKQIQIISWTLQGRPLLNSNKVYTFSFKASDKQKKAPQIITFVGAINLISNYENDTDITRLV